MIDIVHGNLLDSPAQALVNTVNTVGVMGKGIALQFKKAFPENFQAYARACKEGRVRVGEMFVTRTTTLRGDQHIINFPTKRHWKEPSRIEDIKAGLIALAALVRDQGLRSIAVPPLGCGLGGLQWPEVKALIEQSFASLPEVTVSLYAPQSAPEPQDMPNRTPRPHLTQGRAAFLGVIGRYCRLLFEPVLTLLETQKLCYFLQVAGEPLRLTYKEHWYGPYADNLRFVLNTLEGHCITGWGDGQNRPFATIQPMPGAYEKAMAYLDKHPDTKQRFERVSALAEGFETPYGMELLATVHWIASKEGAPRPADRDSVLAGVRAWTSRKSRLFQPRHVDVALRRLGEQGWLG